MSMRLRPRAPPAVCAGTNCRADAATRPLSRRPRDAQAREDVRIVAVDLQEMAPIEGVVQLQGDITGAATVQAHAGSYDRTSVRHIPVLPESTHDQHTVRHS